MGNLDSLEVFKSLDFCDYFVLTECLTKLPNVNIGCEVFGLHLPHIQLPSHCLIYSSLHFPGSDQTRVFGLIGVSVNTGIFVEIGELST